MLEPVELKNDLVLMRPLQLHDFESLYEVAADPMIWEQHPNPNRYQREVFQNYFDGAIESAGAYIIYDASTGHVIGSSRFYDHFPDLEEIKIGYTFFSRSVWGKGHNHASKHLMMEYAFRFVDQIIFHVGESNIRSRIAMTRLGATMIGMETIAYYGEPDRLNCVFRMLKKDWDRKTD